MRAAGVQLWNEENGAIITAEIIIIMTVLVLGLIVGVSSVRDAVVTELADVAQAISNMTQSFFYGGAVGHSSETTGSLFEDLADFCDRKDQQNVQQSKCVVVGTPASSEATATLRNP